ncbi:beta-1,4-galactosyltransferase galt-1-like isoform X1 [Biomphalaria glabrata]|uniref:Glycosyltransferase family 92 protein n=1 Tax=Biomphalaria glabrata TaxID=6526 RepID=A0A9W3BEG4_BIOGL|nr:beta-1,4-galactosyltransferase galt-1-like isoform X1 [Biomphalaria glabrata]XP_055897972.1 beta-1,4-galactosyltransferase galt-1-like isoform X1 [Biomphalaria glabrata]
MLLHKKLKFVCRFRYLTALLLLCGTSILLIQINSALRRFQSYRNKTFSSVIDRSLYAWEKWTSSSIESVLYRTDETFHLSTEAGLTRETTTAPSEDVLNLRLRTVSSISMSPKGIPDKPRFQKVNDFDAWLFSAFYDNLNNSDLIRVFGIQPLLLNTPVFCHLTEGIDTYTVEGKKTALNDWHKKRRRVFSYECPLNETSRPNNVSLTFVETDTPTNSFLVLYPERIQRNFTVCYSMLFNFNTPYQLVQNVEFNRVLGAEHFFLYRESVSSAVDTVLKHYQRQGFLTVIEWPIPVGEIHYHGQILSLNDCAYRNRGVSRYVVIQDTDEFIIPHQHDNWTELIEVLNKEFEQSNKSPSENLGAYIVLSSFYQQSPSSSEWKEIKRKFSVSDQDFQKFANFSLNVFSDLKRLNMYFRGQRQKSFVRPETVLFNDIHSPDKYRPGIAKVKVHVDLAVVHHQRRYSSPQNNILDTTSLRFKDRVLPLISETVSLLSL